MKKIFTIGLNNNPMAELLGNELISMSKIDSDGEIHEFIEKQLFHEDFDALIIPFDKESSNLAFRFALHLRLTEKLLVKRLCKIVFASNLFLDTVIRDAGIYGYILSTRGTKYLQNPNEQIVHTTIEKLQPLTPDYFVEQFLDHIIIKADEKIGRHSLANIWGALKLEKSANINILKENKNIERSQHSLYFKYVSAFNYNYAKLKPPFKQIFDQINLGKPQRIKASGKKILLIDDEADKGWAAILEEIFILDNKSDFKVIDEKVSDYSDFSEDSKDVLENQSFDLYLLDLRLKGIEEEEIINTNEMSGSKVLSKLKEFNRGNQVIIFTASNKVWNLKELLMDNSDSKADGYYLKESPEYNFSDKVSYQNYLSLKETITECLNLSYLKDFWKQINDIKSKNYTHKSEEYQQFAIQSFASLDVVFELLKLNRKQEITLFRYAFLSFYQIIEKFCDLKENFNKLTNTVTLNNRSKKRILTRNPDKTQSSELRLIFSDIRDKKIVEILHEPVIISNEEEMIKVTLLIKFVAIGYFKLGFTENLAKLFIEMNEIRNDIAHGKNLKNITIEEIKDLFIYIKMILQ